MGANCYSLFAAFFAGQVLVIICCIFSVGQVLVIIIYLLAVCFLLIHCLFFGGQMFAIIIMLAAFFLLGRCWPLVAACFLLDMCSGHYLQHVFCWAGAGL